MKASNPQNVRKNNLLFLMTLIRGFGPLSKRELSEKSGLSVVTINKLIPELLEKNLIEPYSTDVVTGGRYAISYSFNQKRFYSLVIKVVEKKEQINFFFYLCDLSGDIIEEKELSGNQLEWSDLLGIIDSWKKEYPTIKSIVVGIPGVEKSGVITLVDYPMLQGKNIKKELEEKFDCLVQIENDVNAAILGFSNQEEKNLIIAGIYYPVGFPPGGGVTINQRLLKGNNNFVGEVAELPLDVDWSKNVQQINIKKNIIDVSRAFISLYDPHEIVVYISKSRIDDEKVQEIRARLRLAFPLIELPKIIVTENFNQDYFLGLKKLGIEQLNTVLQQEVEVGV